MRQQLVDHSGAMCWQAREHVPQIDERIVPVQLCRTDQTHDDCSPFAGAQ